MPDEQKPAFSREQLEYLRGRLDDQYVEYSGVHEAATGSPDKDVQSWLTEQVRSTIRAPSDHVSQTGVNQFGAIAMMTSIQPGDGIEGMLAAQMVATQNGAMEFMRRGMDPSKDLSTQQAAIQNATKLMSVFTRQVEALAKHRGKGPASISVDQVTVNAGGQAIVSSTITTGPGTHIAPPAGQPALTDKSAESMPLIEEALNLRADAKKEGVRVRRGGSD
jgi:hypothetical protein